MKDSDHDLDGSGAANAGKFLDPHVTAKGEPRAQVALTRLDTLWFNTGTLCNIECVNCYIESSPTNDALVYLSLDTVQQFLNEIDTEDWSVREIGFTGGEPFMNPVAPDMIRLALTRGYDVLVLTNAMRPMMRPAVQSALFDLPHELKSRLTFRVSLDHHRSAEHDAMRGAGSFDHSVEGMRWLRDNGFKLAVAARSIWGETDAEARAGFQALFRAEGFDIDAYAPSQTVIFPEMDMAAEVPEITTACWDILGKSPEMLMCSNSRMVVHRKGETRPSVAACTLLPYAAEFDMGSRLAEAAGMVSLNHPHCAKFCVLGGASCSA